MITIASLELIAELDHVVAAGSLERRGQILRRITSLFLSGAARLSEEHIELFDDVFIRLIDCIDAPTLAAFSTMLSKQTSAPRHTIRRLAFDDDATVAAPVLLSCAKRSGQPPKTQLYGPIPKSAIRSTIRRQNPP